MSERADGARSGGGADGGRGTSAGSVRASGASGGGADGGCGTSGSVTFRMDKIAIKKIVKESVAEVLKGMDFYIPIRARRRSRRTRSKSSASEEESDSLNVSRNDLAPIVSSEVMNETRLERDLTEDADDRGSSDEFNISSDESTDENQPSATNGDTTLSSTRGKNVTKGTPFHRNQVDSMSRILPANSDHEVRTAAKENIVSTASSQDELEGDVVEFPDGDRVYKISNSVENWTQCSWRCVSTGSVKNGGILKKYCVGTYECPVQACPFTRRPQLKIDNTLQPPNRPCPTHNQFPVFKSCKAIIEYKLINGVREIHHHGVHEHKRHKPMRPNNAGKKRVREMSVGNNLPPSVIKYGLPGQEGLIDVHAAYEHSGRVRRDVKAARQGFKIRTMEQLNEWLSRTEDRLNSIVSADIGPLRGHTTVMTSTMISILNDSIRKKTDAAEDKDDSLTSGPFFTDAQESLCPRSRIEITSVFSEEMNKIVPICITIFEGGVSTVGFKKHFEMLIKNMDLNVLSCAKFVLDFELAQRNALFDAVRAKQPTLDPSGMIRGCELHFLRSITRMGRKLGSDVGGAFIKRARHLLIVETKEELSDTFKEIIQLFPQTRAWARWWSNPDTAAMVFKAETTMSKADFEAINTNNPAESINYQIAVASPSQQLDYFGLIFHVVDFVERLPKDLNAARSGSDREWGRKSPYKKRPYVPGDPSLSDTSSSRRRTKRQATSKQSSKGRPTGSKNKGVQIPFLNNKHHSCHIDCIAFAFFAAFSRNPNISNVIERYSSNPALIVIAKSFSKWINQEAWSTNLQDTIRRMCLVKPNDYQAMSYLINRMLRGAENDAVLKLLIMIRSKRERKCNTDPSHNSCKELNLCAVKLLPRWEGQGEFRDILLTSVDDEENYGTCGVNHCESFCSFKVTFSHNPVILFIDIDGNNEIEGGVPLTLNVTLSPNEEEVTYDFVAKFMTDGNHWTVDALFMRPESPNVEHGLFHYDDLKGYAELQPRPSSFVKVDRSVEVLLYVRRDAPLAQFEILPRASLIRDDLCWPSSWKSTCFVCGLSLSIKDRTSQTCANCPDVYHLDCTGRDKVQVDWSCPKHFSGKYSKIRTGRFPGSRNAKLTIQFLKKDPNDARTWRFESVIFVLFAAFTHKPHVVDMLLSSQNALFKLFAYRFVKWSRNLPWKKFGDMFFKHVDFPLRENVPPERLFNRLLDEISMQDPILQKVFGVTCNSRRLTRAGQSPIAVVKPSKTNGTVEENINDAKKHYIWGVPPCILLVRVEDDCKGTDDVISVDLHPGIEFLYDFVGIVQNNYLVSAVFKDSNSDSERGYFQYECNNSHGEAQAILRPLLVRIPQGGGVALFARRENVDETPTHSIPHTTPRTSAAPWMQPGTEVFVTIPSRLRIRSKIKTFLAVLTDHVRILRTRFGTFTVPEGLSLSIKPASGFESSFPDDTYSSTQALSKIDFDQLLRIIGVTRDVTSSLHCSCKGACKSRCPCRTKSIYCNQVCQCSRCDNRFEDSSGSEDDEEEDTFRIG